MVIGCYLNPNYRLALLCDKAIIVARKHLHMALGTFLLKTGVFAYPRKTNFDESKADACTTTLETPVVTGTVHQTRVQTIINAKQHGSAQRLPLSQPSCGLMY